MSPYPHLFRPLDLGFLTLAQPHRHGLHAHAARDRWTGRSSAISALLCRARQGRRRAHHHRRVLAQRGRADGAGCAHLQRGRADRGASPRHGCRARGGRKDRAADPACRALREGRGRGRAVHHRLADQSECAQAHERGRHRAHHRGLRRDRGARARGRLRRRRDHGHAKATSSTSSPRRAPTTAPMPGAAASTTGCGCGTEIMRRGARARRARFPHRLPRLLDRSRGGRPHRRGDRRRGAAPSRPRAPTSSTRASAGTRRACRPSPRRCRARPGRSRRGD